MEAMDEMRIFRRREGAVSVVVSWAEHMREHARVTVEDQAIEARAFGSCKMVSHRSPRT